jgi:hypothetical protein
VVSVTTIPLTLTPDVCPPPKFIVAAITIEVTKKTVKNKPDEKLFNLSPLNREVSRLLNCCSKESLTISSQEFLTKFCRWAEPDLNRRQISKSTAF